VGGVGLGVGVYVGGVGGAVGGVYVGGIGFGFGVGFYLCLWLPELGGWYHSDGFSLGGLWPLGSFSGFGFGEGVLGVGPYPPP
jgi:hypothetical protein